MIDAYSTRRAPGLVLALCALSAHATGEEFAAQTLDRVAVNSAAAVLEMHFDDPRRAADFTQAGITGSRLRSCALTAIDGLYCLDGNLVRRWPNQAMADESEKVVDCLDPALGLQPLAPGACTALTADASGTVWLAGRNGRKTYSLIGVVAEADDGSCPGGFAHLARTAYCADEVATGRPLIVDLVAVHGDLARDFIHGEGVLAVENHQAVVFHPRSGAPIEIASGQQEWNLQGKEQILAAALLRVSSIPVGNAYRVLAVTTSGRIMALDPAAPSPAVPVFDLSASRSPSSVKCGSAEAGYRIRTSAGSGLAYVTDRAFCEVVALRPLVAQGAFAGLVNAQEPVFDSAGNPVGMRNLTLSTAAGPSAVFPPEGPSVAHGISIDLTECAGSCTLVAGPDGEAAATLSGVTLASQESGMTLFQIRRIPDCRYVPETCRDLLGVDDLVQAGVVVDAQATGDPAAQLLNVTALLPADVTDLFTAEGGLPDMLISRQYRGQSANGFLFDAFFGIAEEGVVFRGTFEGEFEVAALTGAELGCSVNLPPGSPLFTENEGQPTERRGTLAWDVVTTVSERVPTFVDPALGPRFVDTLINHDCGSSRSLSNRWSLKPYNLEITPCTWNDDPSSVWASDGSCAPGGPEVADDAVFAKLLLALYDDLRAALNQVACSDVDGGGVPPLSAASCSTLDARWVIGKDKLDKCWSATRQPKSSSGRQTCNAFVSQFASFSDALASADPFGPDPANRRGELRARVETLLHVYEERFLPSLPAQGFEEP